TFTICVTRPAAFADTITARRVSQVSDLVRSVPPPDAYRVHLIDVATGLAVLVEGHDFELLFDGGSNDDKAQGVHNRLIAYLYAAIGPSGDKACVPAGDSWPATDSPRRTIQHVVLSHPHNDHNALLPDVLRCYHVESIWDSGAVNPTAVHHRFIEAVADDGG